MPNEALPEDIAPEWWTAMSRTDDDDERVYIGRIPRQAGPVPPVSEGARDVHEGARRRTIGMLALGALLGVLIVAGVLTRLMS